MKDVGDEAGLHVAILVALRLSFCTRSWRRPPAALAPAGARQMRLGVLLLKLWVYQFPHPPRAAQCCVGSQPLWVPRDGLLPTKNSGASILYHRASFHLLEREK